MFRDLINTFEIKSENTILKIFISYICTPFDKTHTKKVLDWNTSPCMFHLQVSEQNNLKIQTPQE